MQTIDMTPEEIREELRALREAGEKVVATRESALAFLARIGTDRLPADAFSEDDAQSTDEAVK